jgi:hypothetical protein
MARGKVDATPPQDWLHYLFSEIKLKQGQLTIPHENNLALLDYTTVEGVCARISSVGSLVD